EAYLPDDASRRVRGRADAVIRRLPAHVVPGASPPTWYPAPPRPRGTRRFRAGVVPGSPCRHGTRPVDRAPPPAWSSRERGRGGTSVLRLEYVSTSGRPIP